MARGYIEIRMEKCKGCGLCVAVCKKGNIVLSEGDINVQGYAPAKFDDPEGECTGCKMCAEVCPDCCITVYRPIRAAAGKD